MHVNNLSQVQINVILNRLKYTFSPLSLHEVYFWSLNFIKYTFSPKILTPLILLTESANSTNNSVNLSDDFVIKYYQA